MFFISVCIVAPTLVFALNNTNIITNEKISTVALINTTFKGKIESKIPSATIILITELRNNYTTMETTEIKTKSVPLQNTTKTGLAMETQKKLENSTLKIEKFKRPTAKQNWTKVVKKRQPIKKDLPDMPLKSDLDEILTSIHKMIDFFLENNNYVDLSLYFGLFLLDVNLNKVFKENRHRLPSTLSFNLRNLLEKNQYLMNFYKRKVDLDVNPVDQLGKNLTTLFSKEYLWMDRMKQFDGAHVNDTVNLDYQMLQSRYSDWDVYLNNVRDFEQAEPNPERSDKCLAFLAKNPAHETPWKIYCNIPEGCRIPVERGSNFGYGLTHRLMFIQLAYYGHRCSVFSYTKDREMRQRFCKILYAEASYISMNDYALIDIFVEQLALCALDGHYEFLRQSWLKAIIDFQTQPGCFSDMGAEAAPQRQVDPEPRGWRLDRGQNLYILNGRCNIHTSAAAAATLGFGVKFIIETFYL